MFKNTNSKRMTGILLALVLVTACFIGGSIARYVTSTSSEDEARVAKWGFSETPEPITMDLFKNEYKLNGNTVVAKSNDDADIIAPGLNGVSKFKFVTSSVSPEVMYEVKISVDDSEIADEIKNHPGIQWKVDNGNWVTWDEMVASLVALSGDPSGMKVYAPGELHNNFKNTTDHTIAWQWVMDSGYDIEDTAMGNLVASGTPITAKIVVTVLAQQTDIDSTGMLEGNGSVYNKNDPQPLTFKADADYNTFSSVEVDGTTVTSGNYEKSEGSIKIKLSKDYLASLSLGDHKIAIKTNDGKSIESKFIVTDSTTIAHNGIIPEGGIYYVSATNKDNTTVIGDYSLATTVYTEGDSFPKPQTGDVYVYEDYEYRYNFQYCYFSWGITNNLNGWGLRYKGNSSTPGNILTTINNKDLISMQTAFSETNIATPPIIPETVINLNSTFSECKKLKTFPIIPKNVENINGCFHMCNSITDTTITINSNVLKEFNFMYGPINWIDGDISDELKQKIANENGFTLINPNDKISSILAENSWETISNVTKSGKASEYWSVGDKTTVKVNGEDKEVAIIGIDHDGENTVTFVFTEKVATAPMNSESTSSGSWENSLMRTNTMQTIFNGMANKDLLKSVEKKTIKGYTDGNFNNTIYELKTTQDKLFLLSHTEVLGDTENLDWDTINEGTQYEYFKTENNRFMKNSSNNTVSWWLRTPIPLNVPADFCNIDTEGTHNGNFADSNLSVFPAFVIG